MRIRKYPTRQPQVNSRIKEMYDIVVDYSGYSTLAGLIYVFMPGQPLIGKVNSKGVHSLADTMVKPIMLKELGLMD
jgi:hypothetical protein